jgi:Domain of unknown function (DUF4926)
MIFAEYDVVALKSEIETVHKENQKRILLQPGQVGTILENFDNKAYLVDFSDAQGVTYAMESIPGNLLMQLHYEPASTAA